MTNNYSLPQKITLWSLAGLAAHQLATTPPAEAGPVLPVNPQAGPGIECTWFASESRPMTTTLFIDPNRMSIGMERHGGTLQPPVAAGCDEIEDYLDAKAAQITKDFKHIANFILAAERTLPDLHPGVDTSDITQKREKIDQLDRATFRYEAVDNYVRLGAEALQATFDAIEASPWHLSPEIKTDLEESRTRMVRDNMALNLAMIQKAQQNRADREFTSEEQDHLHDIWQNANQQGLQPNVRKNQLIHINYQWLEQKDLRAPNLVAPGWTVK